MWPRPTTSKLAMQQARRRCEIFDEQDPPTAPFMTDFEWELDEDDWDQFDLELTTGKVVYVPRYEGTRKNALEFYGISIHEDASWEALGKLVIEPEVGTGAFCFPISVLAAISLECAYEDDKKMLEFPPNLFYRELETNCIPYESTRNFRVYLEPFEESDPVVKCTLHLQSIKVHFSDAYDRRECIMLTNHFTEQRIQVVNQSTVTCTDNLWSFTTGLFIETGDPISSVDVSIVYDNPRRPRDEFEATPQQLNDNMYYVPLNEFQSWDDPISDFTIRPLCRARHVTFTFHRADFGVENHDNRVTANIYTAGVNKLRVWPGCASIMFASS